MNLEIFIKPRSELDLFEAFKFYDEQSSGLDGEFIRCVDAKLEFINRNPKACPKMFKDFHRGLSESESTFCSNNVGGFGAKRQAP